MRKSYERPTIQKLESGHMNKFAHAPDAARTVRSQIGGVDIDDLVGEYGSPLFVYSERDLRERYRTMYEAFASRYPNVQFAWSYKTNYIAAICAIMHQEGSLAEVVSPMEYEKARELGIPGEQIIFNGPRKPLAALERAIREGASINIDHYDELRDVEEVAEKLGIPAKVGMRVNMDTGIQPQWSRFGFNLENGEARRAIELMRRAGLVTLNGLHCHIGTYIMDPSAYRTQVTKLAAFARELRSDLGIWIDYLDIGGGFPSHSRLKGTYFSPDVSLPGIDEYAEAVTEALQEGIDPENAPRLIVESGRALIDEAGSLISSVWARKRLPDGTRAYIVDAGLNLLFTSFWYKFTIATDRPIPGPSEPCVLYGPLCMNIDVVDEAAHLPPLARDDRLVISPVGAYNNTQWLQFIDYRPNVVLVGEDGQVDLIREAEDLTDMTRRERLPERLMTGWGANATEPSACHIAAE